VALWADSRVTLRAGGGAIASEMVVDEQTGFVFKARQPYRKDGSRTREVRQLGPVTDAKGRVMPTVRAAAQKYAGTDLVIVGLHDAHGKPDDVPAFARTHGLAYQLAIDRAEEKHFGATFRAYGIRGIPNAAVLDHDGRIAFVGRFTDPLTKAQELMAVTKQP
jgi:hypothetical protein